LINSTSLLAQYQTKRPKSERDRRNQDRYAREIAIAEGLAEGRAVGLDIEEIQVPAHSKQ
jgi:hypothetical protein